MTEMELKKVEQKMNMSDLANLLHSALFSLERAIQETSGTTSMITTFHSCKFLDKIEQKKGSKLFSSENADEAVKNFVEFTSGSDFFEHVDFTKINDEDYLFKINGCMLAKNGVHNILNPNKDICPMALIAGGILKHTTPNSEVMVEPSTFTDTGIENIICFLKYR